MAEGDAAFGAVDVQAVQNWLNALTHTLVELQISVNLVVGWLPCQALQPGNLEGDGPRKNPACALRSQVDLEGGPRSTEEDPSPPVLFKGNQLPALPCAVVVTIIYKEAV